MNNDQPTAARTLRMPTLVCLVIANMIGAGVYTTSGHSLFSLGTPQRVMAVWCVAAVIAIVGAICYGGLSRQLVRSGGEYLFLSEAVHPLAGFMAGWISLLAGFTGPIAFAATTLVNYLPKDLGIDPQQHAIQIAVAVIALATLPHLLNTSPGAIWQNTMVIVKAIAIFAFIAIGIPHVQSLPAAESATTATPALSTFAEQLMWISFSFAGFNASIYIAGEAKLGRKTVRNSMIAATLGVSVIYLCLNAIFLFTAPLSSVTGVNDIAAVAAEYIGGPQLTLAVRLLVALSLFTSVSAMLQAGPRVYVKMAEDGLLPRWLLPMDGVPRTAILMQAYLATLLVCAATVQDLLGYISFLLSVSSAATVGCLLLPRFRGESGSRPTVMWPLLPAVFAVATLVIAGFGLIHGLQRSPTSLLLSLFVAASGLLVYVANRMHKQHHGATNRS